MCNISWWCSNSSHWQVSVILLNSLSPLNVESFKGTFLNRWGKSHTRTRTRTHTHAHSCSHKIFNTFLLHRQDTSFVFFNTPTSLIMKKTQYCVFLYWIIIVWVCVCVCVCVKSHVWSDFIGNTLFLSTLGPQDIYTYSVVFMRCWWRVDRQIPVMVEFIRNHHLQCSFYNTCPVHSQASINCWHLHHA